MRTFLQVLILFFACLILYQIVFKLVSCFQKEGMENADTNTTTYQDYGTNSTDCSTTAMILSQKNAGNIEYLKQQVEQLQGTRQVVMDMSNNIAVLNDQVTALTQQQADAQQQLVGNKVPSYSGTSTSSADTVTN
jgi:hypothetical protein